MFIHVAQARSRRAPPWAFGVLLRGSVLAVTSLGAVHAAPETSVKVYTLDCGRIDVSNMDLFADDGSYAGVRKELIDPCYLIRDPKGDLLWDAGIGDQFHGPNGVTLMPGIVAHVPVKLEVQLQQLGVNFQSIRYLAFSHEHIDHIGNANALGAATWLLNRREHDWTIAQTGPDGAPPPPLLAKAQTAHVQWIDGNFDVFGDGAATIIQAPGHTPGHQVLLVQPTGMQPLLIAGDLWHSRANYDHNRVPRINYSRSETLASMKKVRDIAAARGAKIIIQHAQEDFHSGDATVAVPSR
jgi:glyoxylase-like metal-dependent hydrolase (beta-lactamase superfamily II)